MKGAAPHKVFITLFIADRVFSSAGLSLSTLATAILVSITNLVIVPLMVFLDRGEQQGSIMRAVLYDLAHNPLLLSIGKGTAMNFKGRRDLGATQNNSGYRECSTSHCSNVR